MRRKVTTAPGAFRAETVSVACLYVTLYERVGSPAKLILRNSKTGRTLVPLTSDSREVAVAQFQMWENRLRSWWARQQANSNFGWW